MLRDNLTTFASPKPTVGPVRPWVKVIEKGKDSWSFQTYTNQYLDRLTKSDAIVESLTFSNDHSSLILIYHSSTEVI